MNYWQFAQKDWIFVDYEMRFTAISKLLFKASNLK